MHVLPTGMISVFSCKMACKFQVINPVTGAQLADAPSLAGTRAAPLAVECERARRRPPLPLELIVVALPVDCGCRQTDRLWLHARACG
jgi:hypothetical protein